MSYKLYYFDMRGRAEVIRLVFAAAGVQFQDVRFTRDEWLAKYKALSPTGVAPYLEDPVTGKTLVQSNPIAALLAKRFKLMSTSDPLECYYVDRLLYQLTDMAEDAVAPVLYGPEDKRPDAMREFLETKGSLHLSHLAKLMRESATKPGQYAVGNSLTLADLAIINLLDFVDCIGPEAQKLLSTYPELVSHRQHVLKSNKNLADYIANRKGY